MMQALIAGIFGAYYHVLPFTENNGKRQYHERRLAKPRGKLRIEYREKNTGYNKLHESLLAIGDIVTVEEDTKNLDILAISAVAERRNAIYRASFERQQCLAANTDGVIVFTSFTMPDFNHGFVERCLAEVQIAGAAAILLVNKIDLYHEPEPEKEAILGYYHNCGIPVYRESVLERISEKLKSHLTEGIWLLLGQSGTGKSTFMNRLLGENLRAVGELSQVQKGRHTTTNPALYFSKHHEHLALIDVPGLREFGLRHRSPQELRLGYPDFLRFPCRFENCLHCDEPDCGVKTALAEGKIPAFRYNAYRAILATLQEEFKPRKGDYWRGIRR
ncbi:MAG: ribosome small subunit-dependent GTPase A [Turneriella sp.]|nr:ribosome small subunit-dependent GTPase A [Turneriella sp.]